MEQIKTVGLLTFFDSYFLFFIGNYVGGQKWNAL